MSLSILVSAPLELALPAPVLHVHIYSVPEYSGLSTIRANPSSTSPTCTYIQGLNWSVLCLLMAWRLKVLGHQLAQYWLNFTAVSEYLQFIHYLVTLTAINLIVWTWIVSLRYYVWVNISLFCIAFKQYLINNAPQLAAILHIMKDFKSFFPSLSVVKTTILLKDINDWPAVNEIYAKCKKLFCWYMYLCISTLNMRRQSYPGLTRPISWLLKIWLLVSPDHQHPWYYVNRQVFVFHEKGFQLPVSYQYEEMTEIDTC